MVEGSDEKGVMQEIFVADGSGGRDGYAAILVALHRWIEHARRRGRSASRR
jgi:hypothetical protein